MLVEYNDAGFWAKEEGVQLWLAALCRQIERDKIELPWLREGAEHWRLEAVRQTRSCMEPELDERVKGSDSAELLAQIGDRALTDLESMAVGGTTRISIETFGLNVEEDDSASGRASLEYTIAVGRAFVALLRREFPREMNPAPYVGPKAVRRFPQRTEDEARAGGFTYRRPGGEIV